MDQSHHRSANRPPAHRSCRNRQKLERPFTLTVPNQKQNKRKLKFQQIIFNLYINRFTINYYSYHKYVEYMYKKKSVCVLLRVALITYICSNPLAAIPFATKSLIYYYYYYHYLSSGVIIFLSIFVAISSIGTKEINKEQIRPPANGAFNACLTTIITDITKKNRTIGAMIRLSSSYVSLYVYYTMRVKSILYNQGNLII